VIGAVPAEAEVEDGMKSCMTVLARVLALIGVIAFTTVFLLALAGNPHNRNSPRAGCTSNLHEIYQALKIYQDDHGSYPEALCSFVDAATGQGVAGLYRQYIKERAVFRCPQAPVGMEDRRRVLGRHPKIGFAHHPTRLYPIGDSYDGQFEPPEVSGAYTVRYVRRWSAGATGADAAHRELGDPDASEDTVVTWCGYHRSYFWGRFQPASSLDIVLFLDGHVKPVATARMAPVTVGGVVPPDHSYRVQRD
jgi:hypothetical protein